MLRHKSIPCLLTTNNNIWNNLGCEMSDYGVGDRNDLKDRFYNLQDQHIELKREANQAQNQIRMLNTRLSRLLSEKKRFYKNIKSEREIAMEEKMLELEQLLRAQEQQNERLKERLQLMRINSATNHNHNHNHNHHSFSQSLNSLKSTANTARISSAYSHVRSRTDSGLGFYFRPLNLKSCLRARSQTDLRSQKKPVNFQAGEFSDNLLAIDTQSLMQEAKEEIIRLESIVQKQQEMINSFRSGNFFADPTAKNALDFNDNPSMLSYTIMTRTTTSNLTTATTTADNNHATLVNGDNKTGDLITNGDLENSNDKILDSLWLKYQQILLHKENNQRVSNECQQIIERLYLAVKEERKRYEFLKTKFNSLPTYTSIIFEKNKIIETLKKENVLLQDSLKQCADKIINNNGENGKNVAEQYQLINENEEQPLKISSVDKYNFDNVHKHWKQKRKNYEQHISQLDDKILELGKNLRKQELENESLAFKYENLKQLNECDQLKIEHLEEKVKRLSGIVFSSNEGPEKNDPIDTAKSNESINKNEKSLNPLENGNVDDFTEHNLEALINNYNDLNHGHHELDEILQTLIQDD